MSRERTLCENCGEPISRYVPKNVPPTWGRHWHEYGEWIHDGRADDGDERRCALYAEPSKVRV